MTALAHIVGNEVIGQPGQNLTAHELTVLVNLADGVPTPVIAQHLRLDPVAMRHVETSIMGKLAAKNKMHMITRAFTLGVLIPQALSVLLCLAAVLEAHQDYTRPKNQRRARTVTETSRNLRGTSASAGAGSGSFGELVSITLLHHYSLSVRAV
ncbi:LuxR C-terminal-related transcriptional regulator [Pseudomonas viridiflava]|uniref:LuxR C-terminal-related transcriptional regulator n=3 Tax=Pseudomonas viridiflava TaxID=33069 RepID=UPI000F01F090|nr:LuxR C-terminal-related transcriptional regulator [Pseudomonas viridiflava]